MRHMWRLLVYFRLLSSAPAHNLLRTDPHPVPNGLGFRPGQLGTGFGSVRIRFPAKTGTNRPRKPGPGTGNTIEQPKVLVFPGVEVPGKTRVQRYTWVLACTRVRGFRVYRVCPGAPLLPSHMRARTRVPGHSRDLRSLAGSVFPAAGAAQTPKVNDLRVRRRFGSNLGSVVPVPRPIRCFCLPRAMAWCGTSDATQRTRRAILGFRIHLRRRRPQHARTW